eukprot:s31_g17.t1
MKDLWQIRDASQSGGNVGICASNSQLFCPNCTTSPSSKRAWCKPGTCTSGAGRAFFLSLRLHIRGHRCFSFASPLLASPGGSWDRSLVADEEKRGMLPAHGYQNVPGAPRAQAPARQSPMPVPVRLIQAAGAPVRVVQAGHQLHRPPVVAFKVSSAPTAARTLQAGYQLHRPPFAAFKVGAPPTAAQTAGHRPPFAAFKVRAAPAKTVQILHETKELDDDLDGSADDPDLEEREERPGLIPVKPTFCLELPGHVPKGITTKPREDWNVDPYFWIDGTKYEVIGKVGSGSFGTVHQALELVDAEKNIRKENFIPVAVKRSSPQKPEILEAALLEAKILQKMADPSFDGLLPRYVSHGVIPPPPGSDIKKQAEVVLAMTKLPGIPLDFWIYGIDEQALKSVSIPKMVDGDLPGACRTRRLEHCADMCLELLRTMCPIFSTLRKFAFHRDISAHNFLIDDVKDNTAKFAVLDFGLAVRADKWRREWGTRNIAGDPRYFAPAAWMQLTCGHKYVACHPESCWVKQYAHRLDHYSFGMLILEMLFALWKGPEADEEDWAQSGELSDQVKSWRSSFLTTRSAWKAWWKTCVRLFQSFHNGGAHALRDEFLVNRNPNKKQLAIDDHCDFLSATVKEIAAPCTDVPEGELYKKVSFVLQVASELINPTGKTRWQEIHWRLLNLTGEASKLHTRRRHRISTEPTSSFGAVAQIAAEVEESDDEAQPTVESMPSDSSFGSDADLVVTKVGSNYSDEADKVSRLPALRTALKSGHRRIWTETGLRVPDKEMLKAAES